MKKTVKAWAIARKSDGQLLDDGEQFGSHLLVLYPVFKKKTDALLYIRKTFLRFKHGRNIAKAIRIEIITTP